MKQSSFNWPAHGLRGLAAAGVFVGHITGGLQLHIYQNNADFVSWSRYIVNLGTYGVELFFVISGYVIAASAFRYNLIDFFARRIVRIYPVFLFFTLVFIIGNAVLNLSPEKKSIVYIISNFLFFDLFFTQQPNQGGLSPNAWSISFEMWFYLFTGVTAFCMRNARFAAAVFTLLMFGLFIYYFPISLYFVGGLFCYWLRHEKGIRLGASLHIVEFAALIVVLFIASGHHFVYLKGDFQRPEVISLLVSTGVLFFAVTERGSILGRALSVRPFRFLGTISYSLYLSHPYVYFVLRAVMRSFGLFTLPMSLALPSFYVGMILGALILGYIVNVTLERKPYEIIFGTKVYHAGIAPSRTVT